MKKSKVAMSIFLMLICFSLSLPCVFAAEAIDVQTEGSGDIIDEVNNSQNLNGAMVWNGAKWVVNPTWAHQYFTDMKTGQRLKTFDDIIDVTVSGSVSSKTANSDGDGEYYTAHEDGNYRVTKQEYWYTKNLAEGKGAGSYRYGAVEYRIIEQATDKLVILRSRGVGEGTSKAYFDVYIEDERNDTSTAAQTTAFIGDPIWYTFPVDAVSALSLTDISSYRTGSLPGAVTQNSSNEGDYYLDIGGGSDLGPPGIGKSFELHTAPLSSKFADNSPAYVVGFEFKYMDSSGNLHKIVVNPALFSETYQESATVASQSPNSSSSNDSLQSAFPYFAIAIVIGILAVLVLLLVYRRSKKLKGNFEHSDSEGQFKKGVLK